MKNCNYSKTEIKFLKDNYSTLTSKEIADKLNRSLSGTKSKITELGIKITKEQKSKKYSRRFKNRKNAWSVEDTKILIENYSKLTCAEIGLMIGRTAEAVKARIGKLGITNTPAERSAKRKRIASSWTREEDERLKSLYKKHTANETAALMKKTPSQIKNRLHALGITLPEGVGLERSALGMFKKGHISWNKGLKGYNYKNSGSFKKGHLPANTLYDGAIRPRKDKRSGRIYLYIRLAKNVWKELHIYNWEKINGPIPKKNILIFKDGNTKNCDPKNLELITMAENLKRNRPADLHTNRDKYMLYNNRFIASKFVPKASKKTREEFAKDHPELIKLKRSQIILERTIKNAT